MAMNTCASCKFFEQVDPGQGVCRRMPPTPYPTGENQVTSFWPTVQPQHWCGEWTVRLEIARHLPPAQMQQ